MAGPDFYRKNDIPLQPGVPIPLTELFVYEPGSQPNVSAFVHFMNQSADYTFSGGTQVELLLGGVPTMYHGYTMQGDTRSYPDWSAGTLTISETYSGGTLVITAHPRAWVPDGEGWSWRIGSESYRFDVAVSESPPDPSEPPPDDPPPDDIAEPLDPSECERKAEVLGDLASSYKEAWDQYVQLDNSDLESKRDELSGLRQKVLWDLMVGTAQGLEALGKASEAILAAISFTAAAKNAANSFVKNLLDALNLIKSTSTLVESELSRASGQEVEIWSDLGDVSTIANTLINRLDAQDVRINTVLLDASNSIEAVSNAYQAIEAGAASARTFAELRISAGRLYNNLGRLENEIKRLEDFKTNQDQYWSDLNEQYEQLLELQAQYAEGGCEPGAAPAPIALQDIFDPSEVVEQVISGTSNVVTSAVGAGLAGLSSVLGVTLPTVGRAVSFRGSSAQSAELTTLSDEASGSEQRIGVSADDGTFCGCGEADALAITDLVDTTSFVLFSAPDNPPTPDRNISWPQIATGPNSSLATGPAELMSDLSPLTTNPDSQLV